MVAKALRPEELNRVLEHVAKYSQEPLRDFVIITLTFHAGLRIGEVAKLRWEHVCDASGRLRADYFDVPPLKRSRGSTMPMHPVVHISLYHYYRKLEKQRPVSLKSRVIQPLVDTGKRAVTGNTLQRYVSRLYRSVGLEGASSHSGRRTFITRASRKASKHGCSIRDVQVLARHASLSSTERYVEASENQVALLNDI